MSFPPAIMGGMTDSGEFDARPVRAFLPGPDVRVDETVWPASVPALAQVLRDGLEVPAGLTVLVGENGSGKSTVVETLAEAYGRLTGRRRRRTPGQRAAPGCRREPER